MEFLKNFFINKFQKKNIAKNINLSKTDKESIAYFSQILTCDNFGDNEVTISNTCIDGNFEIEVVILGTTPYFSNSILQKINALKNDKVLFSFHLDRNIKKNTKLVSLIDKCKFFPNICFYFYSRSWTVKKRLLVSLNKSKTKYILFLPLNTLISGRSFSENLIALCSSFRDKDFNVGSFLSYEEFLKKILLEDIQSFSGIFFDRKFLKTLLSSNNQDLNFNLGYILYESRTQIKYNKMINNDFFVDFEPKNITIIDISYFIKDTISLLSTINDSQKLEKFVLNFVNNISRLLEKRNFSDIKKIILCSGCAIFFSSCYELNLLEIDKLRHYIARVSNFFNFDALCKSEKTQTIYRLCLSKIKPVSKNKLIGVCETDYMQDIKEHFLNDLRTEFDIKYISKPQYYDYHFFYCMVMQSYLKDCRFILTSNDMHKYITAGKKVLTLWHGLGMLKKIAKVNRAIYPMSKIVTSSSDCVVPWSNTFGLDEKDVLPLGSFQTDILYNQENKKESFKKVRDDYSIPYNSILVFFAPTFRINGSSKYYNFYIDIEELSKELEKCNMYIITKKHHVFEHILLDEGVDRSGVYTSKNKHFIVDNRYSFTDLLLASNQFMTDYSSGLFYAYVLNMPVILYAPDYKDYLNSDNGLMINYPDDIAANYVLSPNVEEMVNAIHHPYDTLSEKYQIFKHIHVGSCDGNVKSRLLEWLQTEI